MIKPYRRKRLVAVQHRGVFGTLEVVEQVLSVCGWKLNTSLVERLNLAIGQRVAAVGRRVNTLCKGEEGLRQQLVVFHVYHNFVLPHASLRQPLQVPALTNGGGAAKVWQPWTLAMAAGLTDHVWTRQEGRKCREYFAAGVQLVWLVHPETCPIVVHTTPEDSTILPAADTLEGGMVLPGFALSVREFFAELDRQGNG